MRSHDLARGNSKKRIWMRFSESIVRRIWTKRLDLNHLTHGYSPRAVFASDIVGQEISLDFACSLAGKVT